MKIEEIKKLTPEEQKRDRFYHQYLRRVPSMLFPLIANLHTIRDMTLKPHEYVFERNEVDLIFKELQEELTVLKEFIIKDLEERLTELEKTINKNCIFKEDYLLKEI